MNQSALAFLQDLIRHALAKVHALEHVCDAGRLPAFPKGYLAERTGFALPNRGHDLGPGSGGSAAQAGANMQAVWDDTSRVVAQCGLTPWPMPDPKALALVVA